MQKARTNEAGEGVTACFLSQQSLDEEGVQLEVLKTQCGLWSAVLISVKSAMLLWRRRESLQAVEGHERWAREEKLHSPTLADTSGRAKG